MSNNNNIELNTEVSISLQGLGTYMISICRNNKLNTLYLFVIIRLFFIRAIKKLIKIGMGRHPGLLTGYNTCIKEVKIKSNQQQH